MSGRIKINLCIPVIILLLLSLSCSGDYQQQNISQVNLRAGQADLLGEGIARFYPDEVKPEELPVSLAWEKTPQIEGQVEASWSVTPRFITGKNIYKAKISISSGTSLYGTGEIAGPLQRNGYSTQTWNTDAYGYGRQSTQLYQSHPWVLAVRKDGSAYGVLADTTFRCEIDLTEGIEFSVREKPFPVVVFTGGSPQEVLKKLTSLTGTIEMPPLWALGYHQCRWSYYPDARAREVADEFRKRKIPADVIWFDIHYMDGYRIFTFDKKRFPNPSATNDYLHKQGFKSVWMIDPGVKAEPGYFVYDQGTKGNHWVRNSAGDIYNGKVWPGQCAFPDFTSPEARKWWAGLYKNFMATGIDGVWNDMNEPAVFYDNAPSGTMPPDNSFQGGGDLKPGLHTQYHNVYGMLMVKASREGIMAANPEKRPFVLTRANYIGGHRYAATWTGDNVSSWEHLEDSVPMILNLGLSGQPFAGPDIGGFIGDGDEKMFSRWFAVGALFPFSRGHTAFGNRDKEPWAFGEEVEDICRTALERRYRLLPYIYTLFNEAHKTGLPVMRPLFFTDPSDPELREVDDAFLLGDDLLVLPELKKDNDEKHLLPRGIWRTVTLVGESPEDKNQPQLKIRGGAIIPLGKVIQNTTEKSLDPLTLLVCLDENGKAEGWLYEDAGEGWGFKKGEYLLTRYVAERGDGEVTVKIAEAEGQMQRPQREVTMELITKDGVIRGTGVESEVKVVTK